MELTEPEPAQRVDRVEPVEPEELAHSELDAVDPKQGEPAEPVVLEDLRGAVRPSRA